MSVFRALLRRGGKGSAVSALFAAIVWALAAGAAADRFQFAILGDRTGEAQPGVYEQVWKEAAAGNPAFVINSGDSIEGADDSKAEEQWKEVQQTWERYRRFPLYLVPGNHDIWSAASEQLFRKYAAHPPRYSFDYEQVHIAVLDNSRSDDLSAGDLDFLARDLKAHAAAPVKLIFSHRPSWLLNVGFRNTDFPLHRLARQFGVQYVVAGHIHQLLRFELEGVTYLSMPSSGGHLRLSHAYEDGWFFGHASASVSGREIDLRIHESGPPNGQGRITKPADWGITGLVDRPKAK
ncbi:MAG TPA: metallophosphoesterase [Candidatus Sulfopaludibacter sp.]|nr:metallophosphoesterase [Candidatus Sulfopaludibacter sp.]